MTNTINYRASANDVSLIVKKYVGRAENVTDANVVRDDIMNTATEAVADPMTVDTIYDYDYELIVIRKARD